MRAQYFRAKQIVIILKRELRAIIEGLTQFFIKRDRESGSL